MILSLVRWICDIDTMLFYGLALLVWLLGLIPATRGVALWALTHKQQLTWLYPWYFGTKRLAPYLRKRYLLGFLVLVCSFVVIAVWSSATRGTDDWIGIAGDVWVWLFLAFAWGDDHHRRRDDGNEEEPDEPPDTGTGNTIDQWLRSRRPALV